MAKLNVNGKVQDYQADDGTPLLWVLREQLGLTGTKYGCGIAQCGSCTVLIDGGSRHAHSRPARRPGATRPAVGGWRECAVVDLEVEPRSRRGGDPSRRRGGGRQSARRLTSTALALCATSPA